MGRLDGKVAVVTGAGSGNGRAIARAFATEGARVVAADVNEPAARETVAALGDHAGAVQADVTQETDCARLMQSAVEAFGRLDILVNNAGIWKTGTVETLSAADWEQLMAVNVTGVFLCSKHAVPHIAAAGGGSIVNLASLAGLVGAAGGVLYHASKHAVVGMTQCMALDHAPQGIRVNAICPGAIETPMLQAIMQLRSSTQGRSEDEQRERARRATPLGRIGAPEDVARIAMHLASDEAAWVTGICYTVDGGSGITQRR
jgi:NAD(P)-dependent dehydrogenase (short-subunit alcohol dehydrogenase family)